MLQVTPLVGAAAPGFGATLLAVVLWGGLLGLTVALVVLMRTRWGHARPLSKCVALSIYAHILLMTYAYGTKLVIPSLPGNDHDDVVQLHLLAGEAAEPMSGAADESKATAPWEQFSELPAAAFAAAEPARLDTRAPPDLAPSPREAKPPEPAPPTPPRAELPLPRPSDELPNPEVTARAIMATPIEMPDVQRQEVLESLLPTAEGPDRMSTNTPSPAPASLPAPDADAQLQKLTDLLNTSSLAEAVAARNELLRSVRNTPDTEVRELQGDKAAILHRQMSRRIPKRLADGEAVPEIYRMRVAPDRKRIARQLGGTQESDEAVEAALRWLSRTQEEDGHWSARRFGAGDERKVLGHDRKGAGADADTGISALALLSLLGAGHTHLEGPYRENVQRGLEYLVRVQKADGSLAGDAKLFAMMYCHGMATLALGEAYAMTGDHRLQPFVRKAADFTIAAQHRTTGGWRYLPGDPGDMSQFGWQVMALKSAELAGVTMPEATREGMLRFLHNNTSGRARGLASYRAGERPSRTMTAEAYACRILVGQGATPEMTDEAAQFVLDQVPGPGQPDFYYWYYGSLALFQLQDERWTRWNDALQRELLSRQIKEGDLAGSYPTDEIWSGYGGGVYTTAMATLCLEVYYRYLPVYGAHD